MLIIKLALLFCNIMHTQLVQFSCCAEPHNCAFCCTLSLPSMSHRYRDLLEFLHATLCSFLEKKHKNRIALLFSCQCSRFRCENKQFLLQPKWNCRTRRVIIQSKLSGYFAPRNNYNALKDIWKLFSISFAGRDRGRKKKEKGFKSNSNGEGIYRNK